MSKTKSSRAPIEVLDAVVCRSCGVLRSLDEYRIYTATPRMYMDFCSTCEQEHGTLALYRRFNAYGTQSIVEAVFAVSRVPVARRTPEQARILVEASEVVTAKPDTAEKVIAREMHRRELARRRLLYFATTLMPGYQPGWVHQDFCRQLEDFMRQVEAELSPRLMICVPPRHGKLVADSTPILTTTGWTTHGELRVGDCVFHPSGQPTQVVAVSPSDIASVEVEATNGDVIKVHPCHEWTLFRRGRKSNVPTVFETRFFTTPSPRTNRLRKLTTGPIGKRGGRYMYQLPDVEALEFPPAELLMHPYVLGAWLGDGTSSKPWITHAADDSAVIDRIAECGYVPSKVYVHRTTGVHSTAFTGQREKSQSHRGARTCLMARHLKSLGVLNNKHIPEQYFVASVAQRLELLAGLVDTDGYVSPEGRVIFASGDARLAADVERLTRELGMRPYVQEYHPTTSTSGIVGKRAMYHVGFQPHIAIPTRLARKKTSRLVRRNRVAIKDVRQAAPETGRCIQVAAQDGMYVVGRNLTPTHNSQLVSDFFPSWVLGHHPDWPITLSSYAQSLPIKFSRSIRDRLGDPEYQAIFPGTKVRSDAKGVEEWATTKGGLLKAAGVGTGLTGFGYRIGIVDDPIKDQEEAQSDLIRDNTYQWYQTVFRTRAAPGAGILIVNTRWHFDDPSGRLLNLDAELEKNGVPPNERENWKLIVYPAIAEDDEFLLRDGSIARGEQNQDNVLRLLRKKGEALHPERYPLNELIKIKNNLAPSMWTSLYQQQPAPDDGDFFRRDQFSYRWFDPAYRPLCPRFMTVDYAIGKKSRNDYTVMGAWLLDWDDNLVLLEARRGRFGTMEIVNNVVEMAEKHDIQTYAGEQGQIHMAVWPMIEAALIKKRKYLVVDDTLTPMQDKEVRARPLQGRMQRRKMLFSYDSITKPEVIDIMEREFLQFPNGANDDCVDMCSWAARLAQNIALPKGLGQHVKRVGWKDKLSARDNAPRSAQAG